MKGAYLQIVSAETTLLKPGSPEYGFETAKRHNLT